MNASDARFSIMVYENSPRASETIKASCGPDISVHTAATADAAIDLLKTHPVRIVFLDILSCNDDEESVIRALRNVDRSLDIIALVEETGIPEIIRLIGSDVSDYLTKPFVQSEIIAALEKASVRYNRELEQERLLRERVLPPASGDIIAKSSAMTKVLEQASVAADPDTTVLVSGETGTGKKLVARYIHDKSARKDLPFAVIECAYEDETQFERELFGLMGSAKPAENCRSIFEIAQGGTVFFDQVNRLSPALQEKVVELIKNRTYSRKGSTAKLPITVRIIASASQDLFLEMHMGSFREDLFTTLKTTHIEVPNLKERDKDISPLAKLFIKAESRKRGKSLRGFNGKVHAAFAKYLWPGNVTELKSVCERMVIMAKENELLDVNRLPQEIYTGGARGRKIPGFSGKFEYVEPLYDVVGQYEAEYIKKVLAKYNWNQSHTARVLGIHRNTLLLKLKEYNIPLEKKRGGLAQAQRESL